MERQKYTNEEKDISRQHSPGRTLKLTLEREMHKINISVDQKMVNFSSTIFGK